MNPETTRVSDTEKPETQVVKALRVLRMQRSRKNLWCGRGDLNPHRLTPTTPSK